MAATNTEVCVDSTNSKVAIVKQTYIELSGVSVVICLLYLVLQEYPRHHLFIIRALCFDATPLHDLLVSFYASLSQSFYPGGPLEIIFRSQGTSA
jgi:hypothetical protein